MSSPQCLRSEIRGQIKEGGPFFLVEPQIKPRVEAIQVIVTAAVVVSRTKPIVSSVLCPGGRFVLNGLAPGSTHASRTLGSKLDFCRTAWDDSDAEQATRSLHAALQFLLVASIPLSRRSRFPSPPVLKQRRIGVASHTVRVIWYRHTDGQLHISHVTGAQSRCSVAHHVSVILHQDTP